MQKHAQKWSVLALLITTSGLLLSPAASLPQEDAQPPKEVKVEAAIHLLPGSLKERADSYLAPSLFSQPATPILTQVEKITAESNAQIAAERLQAAEEKAAQQKAAAEKAAAEKAAAEKAAAEKAAAEKAAAEKAEAERLAAEKAAAEKAQKEASQKASTPAASRNGSRSSQAPSPQPSPSSSKAPAAPNGAGIACGPRSGDPNLQAWPAQVRTRIASQFGVKDIGGYRATTSGEHGKGLALDVMTYNDSAKGAQILEWVKAHHKELNVYYVIWEQRIYGDWTGWAGKPMADRGDRTANHFDHVHISFNSGSGTCPSS